MEVLAHQVVGALDHQVPEAALDHDGHQARVSGGGHVVEVEASCCGVSYQTLEGQVTKSIPLATYSSPFSETSTASPDHSGTLEGHSYPHHFLWVGGVCHYSHTCSHYRDKG